MHICLHKLPFWNLSWKMIYFVILLDSVCSSTILSSPNSIMKTIWIMLTLIVLLKISLKVLNLLTFFTVIVGDLEGLGKISTPHSSNIQNAPTIKIMILIDNLYFLRTKLLPLFPSKWKKIFFIYLYKNKSNLCSSR